MRKFTDAAFLVALEENTDVVHNGNGQGASYTPGKFLTCSQLEGDEYAELRQSANSTHRTLMMETDGKIVDPGGTVADRWDESTSRWNLSLDGADPVMSIAESATVASTASSRPPCMTSCSRTMASIAQSSTFLAAGQKTSTMPLKWAPGRGRKPSRVSQPTPPFVSAANLRKAPQIPKAAHKSSWARA